MCEFGEGRARVCDFLGEKRLVVFVAATTIAFAAPASSQEPSISEVMLALVSGIGLVAALLGDDGWDALSWLALSLPLIFAMLAAGLAGRKRSSRRCPLTAGFAPR